jgi:ribonuclease HI
MPIIIYADGSCLGNPGPGGYCALILSPDDHPEPIVGADPNTTNNRMELLAAIVALEHFKERADLEIRSDSQYVVNGMNEWLEGWKSRGWRKSNNKPIENQDFWKRLDALAQRHEVTWVWIRGHDGDKMNELADRFANEAAEAAVPT